MRVLLSWLTDFIPLFHSPEEIAETLTLAGLEVEGIERITPSFSGVTLVEITNIAPHPHADKLQIVTVSDGENSHLVVCGDPSCKIGMRTAFAHVGAKLPTGDGTFFTLKPKTLRQVESHGMLLSEKELELSDYDETIARFDSTVPLGVDLRDHLCDVVFEISLTPNLGHCLSIVGIARELSAILSLDLRLPKACPLTPEGDLSLSITDTTLCPHYGALLLKGVRMGPSPLWLRRRLLLSGYKSSNVLVDTTNALMHEWGLPLHAFDYKAISPSITVTPLEKDTPFITLDGDERTLPKKTLCITDGKEPIAIAGVMGGARSAVSENTTSVLIEAAYFDPSTIRRSSKTLSLRSEASARFERGVDKKGVSDALFRAADMIQILAGGQVRAYRELCPIPHEPKVLLCRLSRANALLGTKISLNEALAFFSRLELNPKVLEEDNIEVTVPSYRHDLNMEVDLIEELARLYGYNYIEKWEAKFSPSLLPHSPLFHLEKNVQNRLLNEGLQELLCCNLISPEEAKRGADLLGEGKKTIQVKHAKSIDQSVLRPSLLPGFLQVIQRNQNQKHSDIQAFEIGQIHFQHDATYREIPSLGIVLTGNRSPQHWSGTGTPCDFFDLKGILDNLFQGLDLGEVSYTKSAFSSLHPGRQSLALLEKSPIAILGEVHPKELRPYKIRGKVLFAQVTLQKVLDALPQEKKIAPLSSFPSSERDWTLTLPESFVMNDLFTSLDRHSPPTLIHYLLTDLYRGKPLAEGEKSATLRFTYRNNEKTLSQEEVDAAHKTILSQVVKDLAL